MLWDRGVVSALVCVCLVGTAALGEGRDISAPAELPPAGFAEKQYVDSAGCAFVRAGYGGRTTWVPRLTGDRQQICGLRPTVRQAAAARTVPGAAPVPAGAVGERRTAAAAAQTAPPAARTVRVGSHRACPDHAPFGQRITLQDGRGATRCTTIPRPAAPYDVAETAGAVVPAVSRAMPAGYEPVWADDRLNPNRARGTSDGEAQMALVWSRGVPRRLIGSVGGPGGEPAYSYTDADPVSRAETPFHARLSSRDASAGPLPVRNRFVQVGTFGTVRNAEATEAALRDAGLPVRGASIRGAAGDLRVVLAGPFASQVDLVSALGLVRRIGFSDVIVRDMSRE